MVSSDIMKITKNGHRYLKEPVFQFEPYPLKTAVIVVTIRDYKGYMNVILLENFVIKQ